MKLRTLALAILTFAGLALLILWTGGFLESDKIDPQAPLPARNAAVQPAPSATAQATLQELPDLHEAVGTVRPRTETRVEAQVQAKILDIKVRPGQKIRKGDPLIILDSREIQSRRDQAREGLRQARAAREQARQNINSAQAAFDQAKAEYGRIKSLFTDKVITDREMDQAESAYLQAEAKLRQSRDGLAGAKAAVTQAEKQLEEAEIALDHAVIRAPEDAEVVQRSAEPGDLAVPGKQLLIVQTAGSLRLEALVREGLIGSIHPGDEMPVLIPSLNGSGPLSEKGDTLTGVVEEIVPAADPRTRTFLVKVGLPPTAGLYSGMFGKLLVPTDGRETVTVPASALRRVGQLETVLVQTDAGWQSIFVKAGRRLGDRVEILSGLSGGEVVGVEE